MIDILVFTGIAVFYVLVLGVWLLAAYELFSRVTR